MMLNTIYRVPLPLMAGLAMLTSSWCNGAETPTTSAAVPAITATKTVWASGLRAPYGIARSKDGTVYVAEFAGGQIAKFALDGTPRGKLGIDLKGPAWVERVGDTLFVSERKANRLLTLGKDGRLVPVGSEVVEPLGLASDRTRRVPNLLAIAHTTSRILRLDHKQKLQPVYEAPSDVGRRYGYRCLAVDSDGSIFITDEIEGQVLLLTPAGRLSVWVSGLDDPTAVVIAPDGKIYVAEEGSGKVSRVNNQGVATVVIDGLGQPRDIEFIDNRTFLVSDRKTGVVWRVALNDVP